MAGNIERRSVEDTLAAVLDGCVAQVQVDIGHAALAAGVVVAEPRRGTPADHQVHAGWL